MMKPPIGTWRALPGPPELEYAGRAIPAALRPRTMSRFGLSSVILPTLTGASVVAFFCIDQSFTHGEAKWIGMAVLSVAAVGFACALTNLLRRDKRKGFGIVGIILNVGLCALAILFWFVAHAAP